LNKVNINSKSAISFFLKDTNDVKVEKLYLKAIAIKEFKNEVSELMFNDVFKLINLGKNYSKTYFKSKSKYLNAQDEQNAIEDVFDSYNNKFNNLKDLFKFKKITLTPVRYKRNSGISKKGDIRNFNIKKTYNRLTLTLNLLFKIEDDNSIEIIKNKILNLKSQEQTKEIIDKINEYETALEVINKFGFDRLMKLVNLKINSIKKFYFIKPHEFKSLNFRTCSRISKPIVSYNKNKGSVNNVFINLGGFISDMTDDEFNEIINKNKELKKLGKPRIRLNSETLSLPISYSPKYHGNLNDYDNKTVGYTVVFSDYDDKISIVLTKDIKRELTINGDNLLGVDVNIKHNLFSTSTKKEFDYERDYISEFVKFLKKISDKQNKKRKLNLPKEKIYSFSKKDYKESQKHIRRIESDLKHKSSDLVKYALSNNFNHIIMEDLGTTEKSTIKSEEFDGVKYTKLWRMLRLGSVADMVKSISYKKGISFTKVPAYYSSQCCSECYHVDKNNRKKQEEFKCVNCGHTCVADHNSPIILKNVVGEDVLFQKIMTKNEYGELIPKRLNSFTIKNLYLSHSESLVKKGNE